MSLQNVIEKFVHAWNNLVDNFGQQGIKSIEKHLIIAGTSDNSFDYKFTGSFETDNNKLEYRDGSDTTPQVSRHTRIFYIEASQSTTRRLWICNESGNTVTPVTGDNYASLTREPNFTFWIY